MYECPSDNLNPEITGALGTPFHTVIIDNHSGLEAINASYSLLFRSLLDGHL
jgi:hypothetical protein